MGLAVGDPAKLFPVRAGPIDNRGIADYFVMQSMEEYAVTRDELLSDLAYARTLAEEGRQAPLIGGAYLVMFGVLLATAYTAHWCMLTGQLPAGYAGLVWGGFGACAFIGSLALRGFVRSKPGAAAVGNRADRVVWSATAAAILAVVIGTVLRAILTDDYGATGAIMAAGFGLYGVPLYATGALSGHSWLKLFGVLAWIVSGVLWFYMNESWAYLIAAGGSVLVLLVPGVLMMRAEPSKVV